MDDSEMGPSRFAVFEPFVDTFASIGRGGVCIHPRGFVYHQQMIVFKNDQRIYQKCHSSFHTTQMPRSKLVMAWAVMVSPRRFFQQTSHWKRSPHRIPASHSRCSKPKITEVTMNGIRR